MLKLQHLLVLGAVVVISVSACASNPSTVVAKQDKTAVTKVVKMKAAKTKVNINKADLKTLRTVKGMGHKRASAIISYREKYGAFKNIYDLKNVKGKGYSFSKKYIKSIAKKITV